MIIAKGNGEKISTEVLKQILVNLTTEELNIDFDGEEQKYNQLFKQEKNWKRVSKCKNNTGDIIRTFTLKGYSTFQFEFITDEEDKQILKTNAFFNNKSYYRLIADYSDLHPLYNEDEINAMTDNDEKFLAERDLEYFEESINNEFKEKHVIKGGFYLYCLDITGVDFRDPDGEFKYELESYLYVAPDDILESYCSEADDFTDSSQTCLILKNKKGEIIRKFMINNEPCIYDGQNDEGEEGFEQTRQYIKKKYNVDVSNGICVIHM